MNGKGKRFCTWIGRGCLTLGLFAGCGHEQEKGEIYEEKNDEADRLRHKGTAAGGGLPKSEDGSSRSGKGEKTEDSSDSGKYGEQEQAASSDVSKEMGKRAEPEEYQGATDPAIEGLDAE